VFPVGPVGPGGPCLGGLPQSSHPLLARS
jgi:hypothetical protein